MHKPGLKIMYVLHKFDLAGSQNSLLALAKSMKSLGHSVSFVGGKGPFQQVLREHDIDYDTRIFSPFSPMSVLGMLKLSRVVIRRKPDIIHCNDYWPHIECLFIKALFNIPVITTFPGGPVYNKPVIPSGTLISYSDELKDALIKKFSLNPHQIITIKNRIDLSRFLQIAPQENILARKPIRFTMICRMDSDKKKSILSFIQYIEQLAQHGNSIEAVIVGGGDIYEYIKNITEEVNLKCKTRLFNLRGHMHDVLPYIADSHFVVGLGRSVMEGMLASRPALIPCKDGHLSIVCPENVDRHAYYNFAGRLKFTQKERQNDQKRCIRIMNETGYYKELSRFSMKYITENYDASFVQGRMNRLYFNELQKHYGINHKQRFWLFSRCLMATICGIVDRMRHIKHFILLRLKTVTH